jgi:RNA-directed DNA polymerase
MAGSSARRSRAMVTYLIDPRKIPIERHIKVRSNANPFDPQWRDYFESRKRLKRVNDDRK